MSFSTMMPTTSLMDECSAVALREGIEAGVAGLVASASAVYAAHTYNATFRRSFGISGKVALAITPAAAAYFLVTEQTLHDAKRNPSKYGIVVTNGVAGSSTTTSGGGAVSDAKRPSLSSLGWHHRTANWVYENPFKTLPALGLPVVAGIFMTQQGSTHLKLSQKVMQTRVYGQASVLTMFMGLMAFREYMDRNGKFMDNEEMLEEGLAQALAPAAEARELIKEAREHMPQKQNEKKAAVVQAQMPLEK